VIVFATYAGTCILVSVFERYLVYFPSGDYEGTPGDVGLDYESVEFSAADGTSLTGWFIPREGSTRTVLFCHGNAGNISHRLVTIKSLHDLGYDVFLFDYRGFGQSKGTPSEQGLYDDAEAAWEYLARTRGIEADRIILCGRSLGGAVAIELATRHTASALVVESTFTNLADVGQIHYPFLPVKWILREHYDSISRISEIDCPKLVLHGRDDTLIPIALGRRLFDEAAEPKRFIETPGGHDVAGFTYSSEFRQLLGTFLRELD
jgi:fermentation-respiration switch protein FrsA (DUF1100 family)